MVPTHGCFITIICVMMVSSTKELLEFLCFKYGTDKSKDDHKYVDFYSGLFHKIRTDVSNFTEIGVASGQSMQVWHEYFPNATLFGIDIYVPEAVGKNLARLTPRVHLFDKIDMTDSNAVQTLNFVNDSMDIIIEDGPHTLVSQESGLTYFWPFVKPGGYYIIEDLNALTSGAKFVDNPFALQPFTRDVMMTNKVYLVDTSVGHRNWEHFAKVAFATKNRRDHDSFLLVFQKREGDVPDILTHTGVNAMNVVRQK